VGSLAYIILVYADLINPEPCTEIGNRLEFDKTQLKMRCYSHDRLVADNYLRPFGFFPAVAQGVIEWTFPDFECGQFIPLRRFAGLSLFEVNEPDDTLMMEIVIFVGYRIMEGRYSH